MIRMVARFEQPHPRRVPNQSLALPTTGGFCIPAAEARVGGLLGKKAGVVHLHVGEGKRRLELLFQVLEQSDIPAGQFVTSHVNRLFELFRHSISFLALGGNIDLTAGIALITRNPARILKLLPRKGIIQPGSDADLVILNDRLMIETVIARGKVMREKGIPIIKVYFD